MRTPGKGLEQLVRIWCRLRVVPELGRTQRVTVRAGDYEPVLLGGERHRDGVGRWSCLRECLMERLFPFPGVLLALWRGGGGVWRSPRGLHGTSLEVADLHLAGRCGRVDPDHECHQRAPRRSSVTSWSSRSWP